MKRFSNLAAVGLLLAVAGTAAAQSTPQRTLADRLGALRDGWSFAGDEPADEPMTTPQRVAQRPQPTTKATPSPRPFPRVNPRELLPRNWFGVGVQDNQPAARATDQPEQADLGGSTGSARARLLRDMRRPAVVSNEPRVASRPAPRAGSVLSPDAPQVEPSEATAAAVNARLARSIAEQVAEAVESAPAETEPTPIAVEAAPQSLLPFETFEGTTPTETVAEQEPAEPMHDAPVPPAIPAPADEPAEEDVFAEAGAEADAGQLRVAANPSAPTKLPLVIGDRYSEPAPESSTVAPAPGGDAFAFGPGAGSASKLPFDEPAAKPSAEAEDLLMTQRMPVLVSKVSGPRTIVLGREVTYRVLLANRGEVGAERVVTRVTVPEWAEVVAMETPEGAVERDNATAQQETLVWSAGRVAAGQVVKLDIRLIARSGRPIELGLTHSHRPVDGRTLVEVQEPKLALAMLGPEEVLFGKPQTFRLTISNPGTGAAENVKLHLTPPGGDPERSTSHDFGVIAAGEERTVEIELTAREAGQLAVAASAEATGGVAAETVKEVFCRKPELVVDWRGPADRYAGAPAVYYLRVRNPGTAVAPDVVLTAELPAGFEVLPGEATPAVENGRIAFRAGSLRPGDDKYFELRGVPRQAGPNTITLAAADSGETRSEEVVATTEVVALADLKLDVLDPKGPVATGREVAYEIRVTNRGSSAARDVRVIGLFSEGIEPHHADGGNCDIHDGRVAFDTIGSVAVGEVRTFTIHARAYEAGTHLFRAEVLCRDLEIKLAAEETTRFFEDEPIDVAAEGYSSGSNDRYSR